MKGNMGETTLNLEPYFAKPKWRELQDNHKKGVQHDQINKG